jgi:hypothetical protein
MPKAYIAYGRVLVSSWTKIVEIRKMWHGFGSRFVKNVFSCLI